jgi:predicted  nucleic acid-binding Zn-ribbon protein
MTKQLPSLNRFWRMLRDHDWTFDYSDDGSVWRRGQAELNAIREVVEAGGEEYKKLFKEYSEYAWRKDDSIKQPDRPQRSKEEQVQDRQMLSNLAEALSHLKDEMWSLEEEQIISATQLRELYNPIQGMISQISNIVENKSKSSMWNTVAYKGYRRIKEDIDNYSK